MNKQNQVLITGCGASGTAAIAKVFKRGKVPFGHEVLREGGMASWYCAAGSTNGDRPQGYHGKVASVLSDFKGKPIILHQVRHPLHTISTLQRFQQEAWRWATKFCPEIGAHEKYREYKKNVHACMRMWYYWNLRAEGMAEWTYRIENLRRVWPEFCKRIGQPTWEGQYRELAYFKRPVHSKRSSYRPLCWQQLYETDMELTKRIRDLGSRYGYKL